MEKTSFIIAIAFWLFQWTWFIVRGLFHKNSQYTNGISMGENQIKPLKLDQRMSCAKLSYYCEMHILFG